MGANAHSRDFYWDHSTSLIELRENGNMDICLLLISKGSSLKIDTYENITIHYTCLIKTPQKCIRKIISMSAVARIILMILKNILKVVKSYKKPLRQEGPHRTAHTRLITTYEMVLRCRQNS